MVAAELEDATERVERSRDRRLVADRAAHLERLAADPLAVLELASLEGDQPDLVQRRRGLAVQAQPDAEPEREVQPLHGAVEVALDRVEDAGAVQGSGAVGGLLGGSHPERGVEPETALRDPAADPPVLRHGAGEADDERAVAVGPGTVEDRDEVFVDVVELGHRVGPELLHEVGVAPLREPQQVVRVGPVRGDGLATLGEPARGVVADDPEQLVAGLRWRRGIGGVGGHRRRRANPQQARRDERGDAGLRVHRRGRQAVLERALEVRPQPLDPERAAEHAEPSIEALDLRREQVVAPVHRGPQAAMAVVAGGLAGTGRPERGRRGEVQAGVEPVEELIRGEDPEHRAGELDRERQAVQAADDPGQDGDVRRGQLDDRAGGRGAVDEEADRRLVHERRGIAVGGGRHERLDRDHPLLRAGERRRRRHEEPQPGDAGQRAGDVADAVDHVLRVVEHHQRRRTAEGLPQVGREALRGHVGQPDARRELRGDLLVGADRREPDPGDAAVDRRSGGARGLDREPRLAGAAGPGQGDDPDRGVGQRGEDRGEVGDAAHERVGWRARRGCRERRHGRGLGVLGPGSRGHDG